MALFRRRKDDEAAQPVVDDAAGTPPHGDQLQEVTDTHPELEPQGSGGQAMAENLSRRERRRLEREERYRLRDEERARRKEARAAAKRQRKEARQKGDATAPAEPAAGETPSGGAEAPSPEEQPIAGEGVDEERAIREAAERAALARLGQARPSESPPVSEPDPFEEDERARRQEAERVRAEAERRIREVEDMQREAAAHGGGTPAASEGRARQEPEPEAKPDEHQALSGPETEAPERSNLLGELRDAEHQLEERRAQEEALARELVETERRLAENQRRTAEALERAAARLEQVESRAEDAEQRAERAERLAGLKAEEIERAERLREMLDRIAQAEQRAAEAERRARAAVERAAEPVPEIDPAEIFDQRDSEPAAASPPPPPPKTVAAAEEPPPAPEHPEPAVDLNEASYEQLRGLGLSVTQTGRLLAHRERAGRFSSTDELEGIPGFPKGFLDGLRGRVRV